MPSRLALVACFGPHEGPWLRARGNETSVKVTCLGEGEIVVMRSEKESIQTSENFTSNGIFPLPKAISRVSFKKLGGHSPTTVELVIG